MPGFIVDQPRLLRKVQLMSSRAVFLDLSPLEQGDLDLTPLQDAFSELVCHEQSTADQIVERLRGAQVAIVNKVALSADTLAACPDLKLILVPATGVNNIDRSEEHTSELQSLMRNS